MIETLQDFNSYRGGADAVNPLDSLENTAELFRSEDGEVSITKRVSREKKKNDWKVVNKVNFQLGV